MYYVWLQIKVFTKVITSSDPIAVLEHLRSFTISKGKRTWWWVDALLVNKE